MSLEKKWKNEKCIITSRISELVEFNFLGDVFILQIIVCTKSWPKLHIFFPNIIHDFKPEVQMRVTELDLY